MCVCVCVMAQTTCETVMSCSYDEPIWVIIETLILASYLRDEAARKRQDTQTQKQKSRGGFDVVIVKLEEK